ncbi:hypothetical protein NDU88_007708 [Pleurodeles waltl]|uniref:Uncharacterized protein n=1 Tax=Pleurodeles waltl TaxID=8319 RepID=A0AAV7N2V5_PLEWA|nr:hypothetical protein NDU88_007708 [Pleurodeles waltl]
MQRPLDGGDVDVGGVKCHPKGVSLTHHMSLRRRRAELTPPAALDLLPRIADIQARAAVICNRASDLQPRTADLVTHISRASGPDTQPTLPAKRSRSPGTQPQQLGGADFHMPALPILRTFPAAEDKEGKGIRSQKEPRSRGPLHRTPTGTPPTRRALLLRPQRAHRTEAAIKR